MALPRRLLSTTLIRRPCIQPPTVSTSRQRRLFSSVDAVSHPSNRVQVYISRTSDPYLNLAVEHFLLLKTPPDSVVLFLYTNRPCVVVGRNQNPWVEVNLGLLRSPDALAGGNSSSSGGVRSSGDQAPPPPLHLVRRRSGGGTVFHDGGNVNYSVICPPASFDRDKHAAMVVRALQQLQRGLGVRVNERHDIVLDVPAAAVVDTQPQPQTYKVSGSAYKLTRLRALHHGTCLLSSPHLPLVGALLRSPAAPYIKARGVESVRSPIRNVFPLGNGRVGDVNAAFEDAVVSEFRAMYGDADLEEVVGGGQDPSEILSRIPDIAKGYAELKSPEWIYTQTPQFTFSTHPATADPRPRPAPPEGFRAAMTVRHGQIVGADISSATSSAPTTPSPNPLTSTYLHQVTDWRPKVDSEPIGTWLNDLFGVGSGR
ncbi:hypothetical protein AAE478_006123 [Parahypoxylon ruwenzoriense]